ncbi:hypothetical protein DFJ73DRAFT_760680 [Zopfochytrium polystomum]|nr:hypothetical protein DFJ73DRAFT_760680 [Zopfochytrium polystomum]
MASTTTSSKSLVIGGPLPQVRFDICWLETLGGGPQWCKLIGCALIIYTWLFVPKKSLWNVLLAHGLGGLLGTLLEGVWAAAANCRLLTPKTASPYAWILLLNETNWIAHEAAVVAYSYIKTSIVLRSPRVRAAVNYFLAATFVLFVALRINIGRLRFQNNNPNGTDVTAAHSPVFALWLAADAVLMYLLARNVHDHIQKKIFADASSYAVVRTLLSSSLPRFAVIFVNNAAIALLHFVALAPNLGTQGTLTVSNFSKFASTVKGTYPVLLLLDILMTRFLLYANQSEGGGDGGDSGSAAAPGEIQLRRLTAPSPPPTADQDSSRLSFMSSPTVHPGSPDTYFAVPPRAKGIAIRPTIATPRDLWLGTEPDRGGY